MPKTVKVAEVTELEPGEGKTVEAEGVSLALFNVDGTTSIGLTTWYSEWTTKS